MTPVTKRTKYHQPAPCQWIDVNQKYGGNFIDHELHYKVSRSKVKHRAWKQKTAKFEGR